MIELTRRQAREALVRYHNLDGAEGFRGVDGVRRVMSRIGTIQYDPLNVAGRNAELALQARVRDFRPEMLRELLYREHFLVDGYDKEMCIYVTRDFPHFAPQRAVHAEAARRWLTNRGQGEAFDMLEDVLAIIREKGPCRLTDIQIGASKDYGWGPRKPSGAAMEYLFRAGQLCVSEKAGTQRTFDLTERTLPPEYLTPVERSPEEFADWYVRRRVGCVGLLWERRGGAWQGYVLDGERTRKAALARLCEQGRLVPCAVEGRRERFYAVMLDSAGRKISTGVPRDVVPT